MRTPNILSLMIGLVGLSSLAAARPLPENQPTPILAADILSLREKAVAVNTFAVTLDNNDAVTWNVDTLGNKIASFSSLLRETDPHFSNVDVLSSADQLLIKGQIDNFVHSTIDFLQSLRARVKYFNSGAANSIAGLLVDMRDPLKRFDQHLADAAPEAMNSLRHGDAEQKGFVRDVSVEVDYAINEYINRGKFA
ncbi:hypothetical protein K402DRAFT_396590 [Aulographum hederae CBS 113979]|uniref:Uncharacterized protein n=1 Tax=Aulographum hederae CBS 113979 TaxID=1176131 RepID=A0A6G1GRN2_9PEZI|nr:hypothetical protein K402DRAFT_396590 [Aulographum hederae CBS 113979]